MKYINHCFYLVFFLQTLVVSAFKSLAFCVLVLHDAFHCNLIFCYGLFDMHVTAMSSISNEVMLVLEQQKQVKYFVYICL